MLIWCKTPNMQISVLIQFVLYFYPWFLKGVRSFEWRCTRDLFLCWVLDEWGLICIVNWFYFKM